MDTNEHKQMYDPTTEKDTEIEAKKRKEDIIFAKISIAKECFKIKNIDNPNHYKHLKIRFSL